MYHDSTFPPPDVSPAVLLLDLAASLDSNEIAGVVDELIARLDARDGDCDLEDDDPAGGNILDERHDEDPHEGDDGFHIRRPHRDRIRRTACAVTWRYGYPEYLLKGPERTIAMGVASDLIA